MPLNPSVTYVQQGLTPVAFNASPQNINLVQSYQPARNQNLIQGLVVGQITNANASDVQTLTMSGGPTGGAFQLAFGVTNIQFTTALAYNSTAAQIQAALQALPGIGAGNVTCTGGPINTTPVVVTFGGALANAYMPLLSVFNPAFTGGASPSLAVAHTTVGVTNGSIVAYASGNTDGSQNPIGFLKYGAQTDAFGNVVLGSTIDGPTSGTNAGGSLAVYIGGIFKTTDLTGLDANAVTKLLARITSGTLASGVVKF